MPQSDADAGQHDAVAHEQPAHVASRRAERHADADLLGPLLRDVGDDAVDAHDAEQQRDGGGDAEHHERERGLCHGASANLVERAHVGDRQVRVHGPDRLLDLLQERRRSGSVRSNGVGEIALREHRLAPEAGRSISGQ